MKKFQKWLQKIFFFLYTDVDLHDKKVERLKELQAESMAIIDKYDDFNFSELDRIRLDIIELKIDLLLLRR